MGIMRRTAGVLVGAMALALVACGATDTPQDPPESDPEAEATEDAPLVVGHRGSAGTSPENTLVSIADAIESGADMVEIDVQLSADGEPFLFHDSDASRTTDVVDVFEDRAGSPITSFSWDELSSLDAGSHFDEEFAGEPIPHLLDVPAVIDDSGVVVNIEVKEPNNSPGVEQTLADVLVEDDGWRELLEQDQVVVSSFDEASLADFGSLAPDVPVYQIGTIPDDAILVLWATYAVGVVTNHDTVHPDDIQRVREADLAMGVYTVNDPEEMNRALGLDLDFIITDFPADLVELIQGQ